jgi:hypothetical protein
MFVRYAEREGLGRYKEGNKKIEGYRLISTTKTSVLFVQEIVVKNAIIVVE